MAEVGRFRRRLHAFPPVMLAIAEAVSLARFRPGVNSRNYAKADQNKKPKTPMITNQRAIQW